MGSEKKRSRLDKQARFISRSAIIVGIIAAIITTIVTRFNVLSVLLITVVSYLGYILVSCVIAGIILVFGRAGR